MRPLLSRMIRRSFVKVIDPPFPIGRFHSACRVRLNGAPAFGGTKMLSIAPLCPPSGTRTTRWPPCCCAKQITETAATMKRATTRQMRICTLPPAAPV
ncbi:hypothetical protein [Occallatibacter savannae]|uniref:hypothetical protein n=1 Tax=Occallatibacter savannae TaxID=1002691 RepID=UPI0013A54B2C|nr:hypothetical protein [Occallatibacter savannae]